MLTDTFPALRHRDFRLFFVGQFVSLTGTWMQQVALGWLVLQLTNSAFMVGLVSTLGSLPILLFTLWGGVVADRVDRRRALILLQSLMLLDALALALLVVTDHVTIGWIMLLAVAHGTSSAFEVPIRQTFLRDLVGPAELMNGIALNAANFNLSRILGPAFAGLLIAAVGLAPCFFVNATSFLAVLAGLVAMRQPVREAGLKHGSPLTVFREGVRYALGEPRPQALLSLTAVYSVFGFSFITMLPVYARDVLRTGPEGYGGLMTAVGLGASLGGLGMAALGHRLDRIRVIKGAGLVFASVLAAAALAREWWLAAACLAVSGGAMILSNIATNTELQTSAPDHLRGRVLGFYSFVVLGVAPLGSLQAGWVSELGGVPLSLAVGGLASAIAVIGLSRRIRRAAGGPTLPE